MADAPDEPVSVAALRIPVDGPVLLARLTLKETASRSPEVAGLNACLTADPWKAAAPGAYGDAPKPDCSSKVALTRDADAKQWTGDVAPLLAGRQGDVSVMIVPNQDRASSPLSIVGFSIEFAPPVMEGATATNQRPPAPPPPSTAPAPRPVATSPSTTAPPPATNAPPVAPAPPAAPAAPVAPVAPPVTAAPTTAPVTIPITTPSTAASGPAPAPSPAPTQLPTSGGVGRSSPDRVRGWSIVPYLVAAVVVGAAVAGIKLALDKGLIPLVR